MDCEGRGWGELAGGVVTGVAAASELTAVEVATCAVCGLGPLPAAAH